MKNSINWPNWVAIVGAILFAANGAQAAPVAAVQGGLSVDQWWQLVLPLLAFVPKFIDLFRTDKTAFTKMVVALAAVEDVRQYLGTTDPANVAAVATLKAAILAKLDAPKPTPTTGGNS